MKKSFCIFLVLALLLGAFPLLTASADGEKIVEGEVMTLVSGKATPQNMKAAFPDTNFSNGWQLWVQNSTADGVTALSFELTEVWEGELYISHCMAADYGTFDLYIDGKKIYAGLDMYNAGLKESGDVYVGLVSLGVGTHTLTLTCVGKNANARGYYGSIDCIKLRDVTFDYVVEAETMTVTEGTAGMQNMEAAWPGSGYSDGKQMLVRNSTSDGITTLSFELTEAWEGDLYLAHCMANDFGIFDIYVDGQKLCTNLDMFNPGLKRAGAVRLGVVSLGVGTHTLTLKCKGKNADAHGYLAGIDCIMLRKASYTYEGEAMTTTTGLTTAQNMEASWPGSGFSGGYQLWVRNSAEDGVTTAAFTLTEAWEGDLYLYHGRSSDFGIFDVYVDGEKLRAGLDMYNAGLKRSGAVHLGSVSLPVGTHTLTLTCTGKNAASRGYYGSIDCITLREAEYDYTYTDTVAMLTDLEAVAKLPKIGEVGAAATSYHRVSCYDEATDTYIEWGDTGNKPSSEWTSNGDGGGNLGTAHGGILAADIHGAGMIVRSWFATIRTGTIEFYIDGSSSPTISMPLADFASAEGVYDGLDNMVYKTTAEGYNNYVPVTFNSSCQIVLKGDWGQYYHFSYRLFPEGTTVEPMPSVFNATQREALENANAKMGDPAATPEAVDGQNSYRGTVTLPKSTTVTALETDGTAAITQFKVKLNDSLSAYEKLVAMQKIEVFMYWDGEDSPAVWAPLGDFFANAGGGEYASVPMGITADGTFYSYWYMPYADGAKIAFKNSDTRDYSLSVETVTAPLDGDVADYGRFHAKWSLDRFQPARADRAPDYTLLTTEGRGRLVGINLHVNNFYGVNWWGEGDEKFFVDGEMFPSTYGTGSEDYFGYAWCSAVYFNNAFHAQNQTTGLQGKAGDYNNVRFHLADNIPFQTSFEAAIEKFYGNDKVQYLATAYWYLDAEGTDPYTPVTYTTDEEIAWRYLSLTEAEKRQQPSDRNTIEGEDMAAIAIKDTSNLTVQNMAKDWSTAGNFSGGKQLFSGITVQSTAEATLQFTADTDYEGILSAILCTASDYATVQLLLDGEPLGDPVDCYNTRVYRSAVTPLGNVSLTKGVHELTIRVVGKNEASRGYLFGLDCLVMGEHLVTYQPAKDATCTENGCEAYWECSDCGKTFADRFATVEITPTITPAGHNEVTTTVDATCETESSVTVTCETCGETLSTEVIDALGHKEPDGTWNAKQYCLNGCGEVLYDLEALLNAGGEVTLDRDLVTDKAITVNTAVVLNLAGYSISATELDTVGDGVFYVPAGGDLTINGEGVINGVGGNNYSMAIWANGGKVTINGGTYTNVGAGDDDHYDLIYVKNGGEVVINGGTFIAHTPVWTLNSNDTYKGTFTVNGGKFYQYDPANNITENPTKVWVADGFDTVAEGDYFVLTEHVPVVEIIDGRYYEDGVKVPYAGLVLYEGNYYYVNDNAKVETGRFFASRFNDFTQFTNGYYYFDENGVMNTEKAVIDGYYYGENGKCEAYAGLVEVDGDYYYVLKNGEVKLGRYAIVKHNDLKAKGIYSFGTDGKMLMDVVENDYYYTESGLTVGYLGLVEAADGNLYYVQAQGKVVVNNARFLVSNHNGLVTKGYYAFDANGVMAR